MLGQNQGCSSQDGARESSRGKGTRDPPEETHRSCKCQLGKNHWAEGSRWAKGLGQDGAVWLEQGGGREGAEQALWAAGRTWALVLRKRRKGAVGQG